MHVVMVISGERLQAEHPLLNRIAVGLIGEGLHVTRVVPKDLPSVTVSRAEQDVALASRVEVDMAVLPWMRRDRVMQLTGAMGHGPPDIVYGIGDDAWPLALDLAATAGCPAALDIWSPHQLRRLPRGARAELVAAYIAATEPLAEALRDRVDPGLVSLAPMGVGLPRSPRSVLDEPDTSLALGIIGSGRDVPAYRELFTGLSRVVRERSHAHVFLELHGPNEHEIWRSAQRLQLLPVISTVADATAHRRLLTDVDVLILPERYGELRTLMLEAMVLGVPIVAAEDPALDMFDDGHSALLVDEPDAETWARHLERLLSDPKGARQIGAAGRQGRGLTVPLGRPRSRPRRGVREYRLGGGDPVPAGQLSRGREPSRQARGGRWWNRGISAPILCGFPVS